MPIDWQRARAGDPVKLAGGSVGVLAALPDRRGRVAVTVGSVRMVVPAERGRARGAGRSRRSRSLRARAQRAPAPGGGGTERCDLRGQRVDEALDVLGAALDRAASDGRDRLLVIHGLGTGALRKAVPRAPRGIALRHAARGRGARARAATARVSRTCADRQQEACMDLKLFATVFATVFVAELGDKTQLATLLYAADASHPRLTVFAASAAALVLTSATRRARGLVSVAQHVDPRVLRWVAGAGFIAVGAVGAARRD